MKLMKLKQFFIVFGLAGCSFSQAQVVNPGLMDTTDIEAKGKFTIEGYIDTYYGNSINNPQNANLHYFVSSARHNEVNINLAYVALKYNYKNIRAKLIPGFGTFMNANYASEPGSLKNLVEANVGVCLSEKRNIWVDVGVLGSPYTNESAVSKDHLMYTRSLAAEYAPYYLSGARFSFPLTKKLNSYIYLLNGWQVIQENNTQKAVGTQLEFRPGKKVLINWNTFTGDERSSLKPNYRQRYFSDIYLVWSPSQKWDITSCAYYGIQQEKQTRKQVDYSWWQANFIVRYHFNKKHSLSGRVEYFNDPRQVIMPAQTGLTKESNMGGGGLCWNIRLNENAVFRLENRVLTARQNLFYYDGKLSKVFNWSVVNLTVWF